MFNEMEQWCMEYAVRSTDFRGRGVGYIAPLEHLHISQWLSQLRQEHGDDNVWTRRFRSLATDVMLLWNVFRYPCLMLLEIGYTSACRSGGLKDIAQACEELLEEEQPLPESIRLAQLDMFK